VALQLLDPKQNGERPKQRLIEHTTSDALVSRGWNPSPGRTLPPLSHPAFAAQVKLWIEKGAYTPPK